MVVHGVTTLHGTARQQPRSRSASRAHTGRRVHRARRGAAGMRRAHGGAAARELEALRRQLRSQLHVAVDGEHERGGERGGGWHAPYDDDRGNATGAWGRRRASASAGASASSSPGVGAHRAGAAQRGGLAKHAHARTRASSSSRSSPARARSEYDYGDWPSRRSSPARSAHGGYEYRSEYGAGRTTSLRGSPAGSLSGRSSTTRRSQQHGTRSLRNSPPPPPSQRRSARAPASRRLFGEAGRSAQGSLSASSRRATSRNARPASASARYGASSGGDSARRRPASASASARQGRASLPGYMQPRTQNSRSSRSVSRAGSRHTSRPTSRAGSRIGSRAHSPEAAFRSRLDRRGAGSSLSGSRAGSRPTSRSISRAHSISPSRRGGRRGSYRGYDYDDSRQPLHESQSYTLGTLHEVRATLTASLSRTRGAKPKGGGGGSARAFNSARAAPLSRGATSKTSSRKRSSSARGLPSYMRPLERSSRATSNGRTSLASERSAPLLSKPQPRRSRSVLDRTPSPPPRAARSQRGRRAADIYGAPVLGGGRRRGVQSARARTSTQASARERHERPAAASRRVENSMRDDVRRVRGGSGAEQAGGSHVSSYVDSVLSGAGVPRGRAYDELHFGASPKEARGRERAGGTRSARASVRMPTSSRRMASHFASAPDGTRVPVSAAAIAAAAESSRRQRVQTHADAYDHHRASASTSYASHRQAPSAPQYAPPSSYDGAAPTSFDAPVAAVAARESHGYERHLPRGYVASEPASPTSAPLSVRSMHSARSVGSMEAAIASAREHASATAYARTATYGAAAASPPRAPPMSASLSILYGAPVGQQPTPSYRQYAAASAAVPPPPPLQAVHSAPDVGATNSAAECYLQRYQARYGQQVSVLPRMEALSASPPRPPAGYADFSAGARAYRAGAATRTQAASTFGGAVFFT